MSGLPPPGVYSLRLDKRGKLSTHTCSFTVMVEGSIRMLQPWENILIHLGFYNQIHGGLQTTEIHSSQLWRLGSPRLRCQQIQCLVTTSFLINRRWTSLCGVSFIRALANPFIGVLLSWPNHLPETLPPNTITLGVRSQPIWIWWGGGCIYSVHSREYKGVQKRSKEVDFSTNNFWLIELKNQFSLTSMLFGYMTLTSRIIWDL